MSIFFFTMPFLLFMPVHIGTFYHTSVQSLTVENLYSEATPMKEFLKGLYMVCNENTVFCLLGFAQACGPKGALAF